PADGAKTKKHRLGRGIGSGLGKTSGRGHKGQKARAGGYHKRGIGFEGGQMPLKRRLPKFGFTSRIAKLTAEIRLDTLSKISDEAIDLNALLKANLVPAYTKRVKVINSGKIEKAFTLVGLSLTKGAKAAIEAAGG